MGLPNVILFNSIAFNSIKPNLNANGFSLTKLGFLKAEIATELTEIKTTHQHILQVTYIRSSQGIQQNRPVIFL